MEKLNSTPAKDITGKTTAESFYNMFDKKKSKCCNIAETLKEKDTNQILEM